MACGKFVLTIVVMFASLEFAAALKCMMCSPADCLLGKSTLTLCNAKAVQETISYYPSMPHVNEQTVSEKFQCVALTLTTDGGSNSLKGCYYDTYKPCKEVEAMKNVKCKSCTTDGCNPATRALIHNGLLATVLMATVWFVRK